MRSSASGGGLEKVKQKVRALLLVPRINPCCRAGQLAQRRGTDTSLSENRVYLRHVDYSGVSRVISAGVSPFYVHLVEKHLLKECIRSRRCYPRFDSPMRQAKLAIQISRGGAQRGNK